MLCLFKEKSERDKARELTKMLIKADDKLVPEFLQALSETNQKHVADVLVGKCLNTFVVLLLSTGLRVWLCRLCFFFFDTQTPISHMAERRFVKSIPEVWGRLHL